MLAYAAIPLTCWLATLIATPRRPRLGNEIEELVYARLMGRQERLRLLAIVVTGVAFLVLVLALPSHGGRDARFSQQGSHYCTPDEVNIPRCYTRQPDGMWMQEP
jgi:hypothetical protein